MVEKILASGENLPKAWPVQGTTGYDFLGLVNQVFINEKAEKKFDNFYKDVEHYSSPLEIQVLNKKTEFLATFMKGELENLFQLFLSLHLLNQQEKALVEPQVFKKLIAEIMVRCPVYRYYGNQYPLLTEEQEALQSIFATLKNIKEYEKPILLLQSLLFERITSTLEFQQRVLKFYQRLMQFTGPLMAKGVEDTLMYTYNRFIGSNEVGDSPGIFGISIPEFHEAILKRQEDWPLTMNASSTHDTKRGEDARSRLHVLTDLRKDWLNEVKTWQVENQGLKQQEMPDTNDEYFIYQNLVATYPEIEEEKEPYLERLQLYLEKALRESKRNSSWEEPDATYEECTRAFILGIMDKKRPFWVKFKAFHQKISLFGRINSLSALLLKHGCPGVPDTYQGSGLWELSMVDPDNRRPVAYDLREQYLETIVQEQPNLKELWNEGANGKIKLFMMQRLLALRNQFPLLFSEGIYLPLSVKGKCAANILSFARRFKNDWLIFILPVNLVTLVAVDPEKIASEIWEDTRIVLPEELPQQFTEQLRALKGTASKELELKNIFSGVLMAVLHFQQVAHQRGAGVLMPIYSLPAVFGIGDFGPEARKFINFLVAARQKYWQVLSLNPVNATQAYSPYSSISVMAGNTLFISPELLVKDGLLSTQDLEKHWCKATSKVKYKQADQHKKALLSIAYKNFEKRSLELGLMKAFIAFCEKESYWLNDYALFLFIKESHAGLPWYQWPEDLKVRKTASLEAIVEQHHAVLKEIKWQQFVFQQQWIKLKKYANTLNIQLIGDLPFYAALDSSEVWAQPELFSIDKEGSVQGMAGVPPDYFNEDGQLWGMPVYNWEAMAKQDYNWWVMRIQKNMELYDLIRLDHFRAFSNFWEVPAGSTTAKTGSWKPGPGKAFFESLKKHFNHLPFLAEDLGDTSEAVFKLRDDLNLPGMKVLQFAFAADETDTIHAPHHFINQNAVVYTGTHDNNTIQGWYENDINIAVKKRISAYIGHKITKQNINQVMIRLAYSAIAELAIIPMQDILGKGAKSRMNTPASIENNWIWRLKPGELALNSSFEKMLREMVQLYGR